MEKNCYQIIDEDDQCFCAKCGYYIKVGENVYPAKDNNYLFCSKICKLEAEKGEEYGYINRSNN